MKKFFGRLFLALAVPCMLNGILVLALLYERSREAQVLGVIPVLLLSLPAGGMLFLFLWLLFLPVFDKAKTGFRVRMMLGGRRLIYCGLYGMAVQIPVFFKVYVSGTAAETLSPGLRIAGGVLAVCGIFSLLAAGTLRIFFTSRRLSIARRLLMLFTMWIPLVNLAVLLYACRLVYEEYDFEREKVLRSRLRSDTQICKTRYPLLMVHGIGFRDLRYFNYWGRIPRELMKNGAVIYYGNQEALGTIVHNGEDIRTRILQMVKETGASKVNIIAHSKGGLDARYAITRLGMAPYVASLTTMSTPHRGCRFVDYACQLPEGLYRFVAGCFDRTFSRFGDRSPDFYTSTRQFSTEESARFNAETPDDPRVYYQSYASRMKYPWSHLLLAVPFCMIRPLEGENDGLVSTESARWGEFRGVFRNERVRGISHGDMIDLKRQDYKGFDVTEAYVQIVAELKEKGF